MVKISPPGSPGSFLESSPEVDARDTKSRESTPGKYTSSFAVLLESLPEFSPRRYFHRIRRVCYGRRFFAVVVLPLALLLLLIISLVQTYTSDGNDGLLQQHIEYIYSFYGNGAAALVDRKKDLLSVDLTSIINDASLARTPITHKMIKEEYTANILTGFVSNLDLDEHKKELLRQNRAKQNATADANVPKEVHQNIIDVKALEREGRKAYDSIVTCEDLSYNGTILHSTNNLILEDDLVSIRRDILRQADWLTREVKDDRDKDKTEEQIISTQWFRFGGASVWLESEQCYIVYSRVIYSRRAIKNNPHISLVRAQAFDRDWNEILGKRIPYLDVELPANMERELAQLDVEMGIENCDRFKEGSLELENCNVRRARAAIINEKKKEKILSKYYITYPTILNIPFYAENDLMGPEDPHVIVKQGEGFEEPVVMFNMYDYGEDKRRMFTFLPHRRVNPLVKLSVIRRNLRGSEKNWTPFFHPSDKAISKLSRGFIHFIYSFSPLDIIRCSLNDGVCDVVFDAKTLDLADSNSFDGMRGGTQFVKLPASIPGVKEKNIWVGFPKLHIKGCGCGEKFYRPMLDVLVEADGVYHQELVVPAIDFDIEVLSWDMKSTECKGANVLSPNAIAHWNVVHQDPDSLLFDDYMTLTVSESDALTKVITLKGVLNYVLGIYREKQIKDDFVPTLESNDVIGKTFSCLISGAEQNCATYGQSHKKIEAPKSMTPKDEKTDEKKDTAEKLKGVGALGLFTPGTKVNAPDPKKKE